MVDVRTHPEGAALSVKANPGARRNAVVGQHDGALRVSVTAAPEKGRANAAVVKVLSKALGVRSSDVRLLSGDTARRKEFLVKGMTADELRQIVAGLVEDAT